MKMRKLTRNFAVSSLLLLGASTAGATVTAVGVDSTAGPNWRTAATLEDDNEYGTIGYVVFGLHSPDGVYQAAFDVSSGNVENVYNLPTGVTITTAATTTPMWPGNAINNFGTMEDPTAGNLIVSASVIANVTGTNQWTISRASSKAYRITFLTASGDGGNREYTLTVNDGSGAQSTNYKHTANGLAYHVYEISVGTSDIVLDVASVGGARAITGIAFDNLPVDLNDPTDIDGNNIGDNWETFYYGATGIVVPNMDEEPDGLTNLEEWQNLTHPMVADSDYDGLLDGEEVNTYSTSPTESDTDDDGYGDKFEVDNSASGFDPLVDDSAEDPDNDGLDNAAELVHSTNAIDPDSDDDNVNDGDEVGGLVNPYSGGVLGATPGERTDPNNPDSDGDSIDDFAETDNSNGSVTDPNNSDTDGDTAPDNWEILVYNTDPTDSGSIPPVPNGLISVDLQGDPTGAAFAAIPVLMTGSFETRAGIMTDTWNAITLPGHPNVATDPSFPLVDSNGAGSGVTFSLSGTVSSWTNTPGDDPITRDYLFVNAGNADVSAGWELSGVSALSEYTLFAYGGIARDMLLTVDTNGDGDLSDESPTSVTIAGFEFIVKAGSDGSIIGSIDPGNSNEANWGGFQLYVNSIALDSDNDGLSDDIEDDLGTDPNNPDSDGDGQSDGSEVNSAGTDPTNSASVFKVTDILRNGDGSIEISWSSVPGKSYAVDVATELSGWVELVSDIDAAVSPATVTSNTVETPAANELNKQYRVRVE